MKANVKIAAITPNRTAPSDGNRVAGRCGIVADIAVDIIHNTAIGDYQRGKGTGVADKEIATVGPDGTGAGNSNNGTEASDSLQRQLVTIVCAIEIIAAWQIVRNGKASCQTAVLAKHVQTIRQRAEGSKVKNPTSDIPQPSHAHKIPSAGRAGRSIKFDSHCAG